MEFLAYYDKAKEFEEEFLIEFLFALTILTRQIHIELNGDKAVNALKQLNELNHRVLNRMRGMAGKDDWFDREYLSEYVVHHVSLAPVLATGVDHAAKMALSKSNA